MERSKMLVRAILASTIVLGLMPCCQQRESAEKEVTIPDRREAVPPDSDSWEVVAKSGIVDMVYVPATQINDHQLLAQILQNLKGNQSICEMMFFDQKQYTPKGFPMTDAQMLHWKARYNYNVNTGLEEFVFVQITDSTVSPPKVKEIPANIRPGYTE